eukprot:TRINITY_DN2794_c0_g1_i2.p1 TRINITY_DN2794_c0_g1~~TRINITY_DN2794_c0_g1_i2.p1  ORF type:complete len:570 (+),score=145.80 TRINITY_DN2794_c0_g1_i2:74-1783(+)
MFVVLAAVDLGTKCNFELSFNVVPTITELREKILTTMTSENNVRRPGQPPFEFHRAQVFDERMEMWVDLVASSQLEDFCQIYVFQRESPWHRDTPGRIPPPQKPSTISYNSHMAHHDPGTPQSPYQPTPASAAYPQTYTRPDADPMDIPFSDKVRRVFDVCTAIGDSNVITIEVWKDVFHRFRLASETCLSHETVDDLFFTKADSNGDGVVTYGEFQNFSEMFPKVLDSLLYRSLRFEQDQIRKERMEAQMKVSEDLEKQLESATRAAQQCEDDAETELSRIRSLESDLQRLRLEERELQQDKLTAHKDSEEYRSHVRSAKAALSHARDQVKKNNISKKNAQRSVDQQQKKLSMAHSDRDRASNELDRLRQLVADQERELMKKEDIITRIERDLDETIQLAKDEEDPHLEEEVTRAQTDVSTAEQELQSVVDAENDVTKTHRQKQLEIQQMEQERQRLEDQTRGSRSHLEAKRDAKSILEQQLVDHQRAIETSRQIEDESDQRRDEEENKENDLVRMEIRLREQREAVERKEEVLQSAHRDFTLESGRGGRSPLPHSMSHYSQRRDVVM